MKNIFFTKASSEVKDESHQKWDKSILKKISTDKIHEKLLSKAVHLTVLILANLLVILLFILCYMIL